MDKIINPSRCNPREYLLVSGQAHGTSNSVASIGADPHIVSQRTREPVALIFTGFLSEVSHLHEPLYKNANTNYPVSVVCQISFEVPHTEFQLFMSFTSYVLNHHQHPDNTCTLTLQLTSPMDSCSWSSIVFAAPRKGAPSRGGAAPTNAFQRRTIAMLPQKKVKSPQWEAPIAIRSFEDGSMCSLYASISMS